MLKRTKRQLIIVFVFVSILFTVHVLYNNVVSVKKFETILYLDDRVDRYFGTKSRYPVESEISGAKLNVDSKFQLRQVQLVCRHGTRYPTGTKNYNEKIEYLQEYLYSNINTIPKQFSFLSYFENPYNTSEYGLLDIQGVKDMQNLARRAIRRYSNITRTIDDISNIRIYSTNVTRVIDSAAAFISTFKIHLDEMHEISNIENDNVTVSSGSESLIEEQDEIETIPISKRNIVLNENKIIEQDKEEILTFKRRNDDELNEKKIKVLLESDLDNYEDDFSYFQNDELLQYINIYKNRSEDIVLSPHIACPLFSEETSGEDRKEIDENIKFLEKKYIQDVINSIEKTLNLDNVPDIVGESVMSMCIFEVALNNTRNQFCSLIDKTALQDYGFYEDYRNYHVKGYYNEVNKWLATPLFKEIVNDIDQELLKRKVSIESRNDFNTNIVLRFAHAETIFPLVTLLGLYKDKKHLTLKDSPPNDNYKFRSTEISPFASNFWFELYEIETKYIIGYNPKKDLIYVDNPFGNQNVTNILEFIEEKENLSGSSNKSTTFVIRVLLNEREVSIPGCSPVEIVDLHTREKTKYHSMCLLSQFKQLYKDILKTTIDDYKTRCHINY